MARERAKQHRARGVRAPQAHAIQLQCSGAVSDVFARIAAPSVSADAASATSSSQPASRSSISVQPRSSRASADKHTGDM